ncbi:MAG: hypothetical protein FWF22_08375 [Treponema sp.]|nr:hypothetical protein [Treponema sp.]
MKGKKTGLQFLTDELQSLIPRLDEEGLDFLIQQAKVHIYNMQVDELNRETIAAAAKPAAKSAAAKTAGTAKQKPVFTIKGTESSSSFYLHYKNDDIMFTRNEMAHLLKIANGPGTDLEIRERLYNWFDRERKDIFALVNMKNQFDERFKDLAAALKKFKYSGR